MVRVEGNGSSVNSTPESVDIQGPSGSIKTGQGVKAGDQLSPELAQQIADASNGQLKVENGYLVGPDGIKIKIGGKLKDEDIQALAKYAPDVINGKAKGGGDEGGESKSGAPADTKPSPAPASPPASPQPINAPTGGIKAGDELSPDLAQKIAAESNGQLKVENGFLIGPDGLKLPIGQKLKDEDIQALAKYAPDTVNGKTPGNDDTNTPPSGEPSAIPAAQSDSPQPVPA